MYLVLKIFVTILLISLSAISTTSKFFNKMSSLDWIALGVVVIPLIVDIWD